MAPRSACLLTLWSPCSRPCFNVESAIFDTDFTRSGPGTDSNALRTTFRPIASSNSASISSTTAVLRLRFLRTRPLSGDNIPAPSSSESTSWCSSSMRATATVDGAVVFDLLLSLLSDDVAVLALPRKDGVAYWRRHSSGLRWSSDSANPRVKDRA